MSSEDKDSEEDDDDREPSFPLPEDSPPRVPTLNSQECTSRSKRASISSSLFTRSQDHPAHRHLDFKYLPHFPSPNRAFNILRVYLHA